MRSKAPAASANISHKGFKHKHRDCWQLMSFAWHHRTAAVVITNSRFGPCTGMLNHRTLQIQLCLVSCLLEF